MSKGEILVELPKLRTDERAQLLRRLCDLQEEELVQGRDPASAEKRLLDQALEEFERDGNPGTPWRETLQRMISKPEA